MSSTSRMSRPPARRRALEAYTDLGALTPSILAHRRNQRAQSTVVDAALQLLAVGPAPRLPARRRRRTSG